MVGRQESSSDWEDVKVPEPKEPEPRKEPQPAPAPKKDAKKAAKSLSLRSPLPHQRTTDAIVLMPRPPVDKLGKPPAKAKKAKFKDSKVKAKLKTKKKPSGKVDPTNWTDMPSPLSGWWREKRTRGEGETSGKTDYYYHDPNGKVHVSLTQALVSIR